MACTPGSGTPTAGRLSWTSHLAPVSHPKLPANLLPAARLGRGRDATVVLAAGALLRAAGARARRIPSARRPLCARQPPGRLRAGGGRQSRRAVREGSNIFAEGWPPQAARCHGGGRAGRGDGGALRQTVSDLEMGKTWYLFSFPVIISSNSAKLGTDLKSGNHSPGVVTGSMRMRSRT